MVGFLENTAQGWKATRRVATDTVDQATRLGMRTANLALVPLSVLMVPLDRMGEITTRSIAPVVTRASARMSGSLDRQRTILENRFPATVEAVSEAIDVGRTLIRRTAEDTNAKLGEGPIGLAKLALSPPGVFDVWSSMRTIMAASSPMLPAQLPVDTRSRPVMAHVRNVEPSSGDTLPHMIRLTEADMEMMRKALSIRGNQLAASHTQKIKMLSGPTPRGRS